MSVAYQQTDRLLKVTSVLGDNVLLLQSFSGHEALSHLFSYELDLFSDNEAIAAKDLVGTSITWSVNEVDQAPRYFNGMVSRMTAGGLSARTMREYRIEVVPKLWFLTRTANCKIYQNKSSLDIIKSVLSDFGVTDLQDSTTGTYNPREYCVQYRETAFNFISRLMEEEGIFYFFQHAEGKHTLVLADANSVFQDCASNPVNFSSGQYAPNVISSWEHQYEYRSGVYTATDYNFETPSTSLLSSTNTILPLPNISSYEIFDYPGLFLKKADGTAEVKIRMTEDEAPYNVVAGASECCTFTPGGKFQLQDHEVSSEAGKYVVMSISHRATDTSYENTAQESAYSNTFTCIPDSVTYRPARVTPKPFVQGPQTAVVVGKSGEEIYVDKYGRIKVQFFWDRLGTKDENSSCWIRVAQHWAGKNWGFIVNPRIGQEVIVDFIEGDPDRPIVTGRVYNAEQMPPYTLPDNMTQTGIKTRSSKGGSTDDFNELRFEDKKGSEEIYFHAQKDFNQIVENSATLTIGSSDSNTCPEGSHTISVYKDRTTSIETGNETLTVKKGNRSATVSQGNDSLEVSQGTRTVTVMGNDSYEVKQGNRSVKVDQGNDSHEVSMGNRDVKIDMGNDSLTISMGNQTTKLDLGASSSEAMQSITLKVGANSITIDQMGVTIKGMMISVQGTVQTEVKGLMTSVKGDVMLQAQGAITMIG
jgi:type VI secretion system secreted protein VgrG